MNYLAIDTTDENLKVLVCAGGKSAFYFGDEPLTHSRTLFPAISETLEKCGASFSDIEAVGVSCGPGSFTGIRIGLAAVKGLAYGGGKKIMAVNSKRLARFLSSAETVEQGFKSCFDAEAAAAAFLPTEELRPIYLQNSQVEGQFRLKFRPFEASDIETLTDMETRYFGGDAETADMLICAVDNPIYHAETLCDDGFIVGYYKARFAGGVCELDTIAVRRQYRGLGFSDLLMDAVEAAARTAACEKIELEVSKKNTPAIKLYEKHGFSPCGLRKYYYSDGSDAILYTKVL